MTAKNLVLLNQFVSENPALHGEDPKAILTILKAIEKASTTVHHTINYRYLYVQHFF